MVESWLRRLDDLVGGRARLRALLLLAAVLGLASADQATIGASATQLRADLHLSHADLGLVAAVSGLVGAVATIPLGSLVDRVNRTRLLSVGIFTWAIVMAISAGTSSFGQLVGVRCLLGAVVAVAFPAAASLIGDYFAPSERGRIWGYVLTGELIGSGFGFAVAGSLASISWRVSFLALALPAVVLAVLMWRLPEPRRGGSGAHQSLPLSETQRHIQASSVEPYGDLVLDEDPGRWSLWMAVKYVLRIRTNVVLIVTGAAGYFFFAGARAFGVEFVKGQYGIGQGFASSLPLLLGIFAIAGVLLSGWLSDHVAKGRRLVHRIYIGAVALGAATLFFVPALLVHQAALGVLTLGGAAFCLAALNPPLDAGRLDIMYPSLWGRAEAVRTMLRQPAEASAPLVFGVLADSLFGGGHIGLQAAFFIMLVPLAVSVPVLLRARRTYPRDVATAAASIERLRNEPYPASRAADSSSSACTNA